jgi:hypothetical protein
MQSSPFLDKFLPEVFLYLNNALKLAVISRMLRGGNSGYLLFWGTEWGCSSSLK